jgi:hypothetical protein
MRSSKARVFVAIGIGPFADQAEAIREMQPGVKLSARGILNAMSRPPTAALAETDVIGWMPVARGDDLGPVLTSCIQPAIERWHDPIASGDRQGPAGTEVVLHIHEDQRIGWTKAGWRHGGSRLLGG